jgi:hypothetical protein
MRKKPLYKIIFHNQNKIYEMYAERVQQGSLFGFIEVEHLVFGEKTSVVVDPAEENLKTEFCDVTRIYIPMHSIIRIDEVNKQGIAKITPTTESSGNVMHFPIYTKSGDIEKK